MEGKNFYLIEQATWSKLNWISYTAKTMKSINKAIELRKNTWHGERIFFIVESRTGMNAKRAVKYFGNNDTEIQDIFGKIIEKINFKNPELGEVI